MLDYNAKASFQDSNGYSWDYYRDDQKGPVHDPNTFYIIPKPQFVFNDNQPSIQFHTYATNGKDNGSGFCRMDVELSVPSDIETSISKAILANPTRFPNVTAPNFSTLDLNPGCKAVIEFDDGAEKIQHVAKASNYGSDTASFLIKLTASQLKSLKAAFTTGGGAVGITYVLNVPARLQSVSAVLSFNSAIAYSYQVTQPTYNGWGDQTSPGTAAGILKDSESSSVKLTWGIKSPPAELIKSVTNWANETLASLIAAQIQNIIAVRKMKSTDSFKISEVQSFETNYSEDMVVDWKIQPKATLPSFPDMGLSIKDFESTINKQQQHMTVKTNVPFSAGAKNKNSSKRNFKGISSIAEVENIAVKINYPTLAQANSSHSFNSNGVFSVLAPYDETAGGNWSLDYTVNYKDKTTPQLTGTIKNINTNEQFLKLEDVGVLFVAFDTSPAFNPTEYKAPDEIHVDFSFVNSNELTPEKVNQKLIFKSGDKSYIKHIKSLEKYPISQAYNYSVTYIYDGVEYKAPLQSHKTGFLQTIPAVNVFSTTNLIVYEKASQVENDPLLEVDVKMWFENPDKLPKNIKNAPTKASPASFTITPPMESKNIVAHKSFVGVEVANSPLVYTANVTSASGQTVIAPQKIMQNFSSIFLSNTQRYFTLEVNLSAIDWTKATYDSIQVIPTFTVGKSGSTTPDTGIQWNKSESESKYHTVGYNTGEAISYDLEIVYITKGSDPVKKTMKNQSDVVFNVPASSS